MPAADISQVQVTFGNGIKREEYGPLKKAEVTIIAIVAENADGVAALNYISKIAQDKVRELLTIQGQAAPAGSTQVGTSDNPPDAAASEVQQGEAQPPAAAEPQRRTRRTKEQIAADAAAAAATQSASAPQEQPSTTKAQPDASDEDEWSAAAPETVTITDAELNSACTDTSKRIGAGAPIKALIGTFSPGGDAWDPDKGGRKFAVNDIAPNQRADFIAKLKQLS